MPSRNHQESRRGTKTKGIGTSSDAFVHLCVDVQHLGRAAQWRVSGGARHIICRNGAQLILIRKLGSYPAVFTICFRGVILMGYAEPGLIESIRELLKKYGDNFGMYRKALDAHEYHEYLLIGLNIEKKRITIQRDAWCVAPIFYSELGTRLVLSNEFSTVAESACETEVRIDGRCIAESLFSLHEDDRTVLADVRLLTERSLMRKTVAGMAIRPPKSIDAPAVVVRMRRAQMLKALDCQLHAAMERMLKRAGEGARLAYELSGGLDTAAVIGVSAGLSDSPLSTYSLLLPGREGRTQREKYSEMRSVFGIRNTATDARRWYPWRDIVEAPKLPVRYPAEEIYSEMVDCQARRIRRDRKDIIVTGFGGDELFILDPREHVGFDGSEEREYRRQIIPRMFMTERVKELLMSNLPEKKRGIIPPVPASVLSAQASRSNIYIRRGIWPLSPLSDPALVAFCRSLPAEWRSGKHIMREYQQSRGYPAGTYTIGQNENFSHLFDWAMRNRWKGLMKRLFSQPVLERVGLVKGDVLLEEYGRFLKGTHTIRPFHLFVVAEQEILFRALAE